MTGQRILEHLLVLFLQLGPTVSVNERSDKQRRVFDFVLFLLNYCVNAVASIGGKLPDAGGQPLILLLLLELDQLIKILEFVFFEHLLARFQIIVHIHVQHQLTDFLQILLSVLVALLERRFNIGHSVIYADIPGLLPIEFLLFNNRVKAITGSHVHLRLLFLLYLPDVIQQVFVLFQLINKLLTKEITVYSSQIVFTELLLLKLVKNL